MHINIRQRENIFRLHYPKQLLSLSLSLSLCLSVSLSLSLSLSLCLSLAVSPPSYITWIHYLINGKILIYYLDVPKDHMKPQMTTPLACVGLHLFFGLDCLGERCAETTQTKATGGFEWIFRRSCWLWVV